MTLTEQLLARGAGRESVRAGEIVEVNVDRAMIHDNNAGLVIDHFGHIVDPVVWDPDKVVFFIDHHSPSTSVKAVKHHDSMRKFAQKYGISRFYDCGCGISHTVMLEEGLAAKGLIVVGTDSHTTGEGALGAFATGIGATEMASVLVTGKLWFLVPETVKVVVNGSLGFGVDARDVMNVVLSKFGPDGANYCAVEFHGPVCRAFTVEERAMCCVLSMEMGAKNALFADEDTGDEGYKAVVTINADEIGPTIAVPPLPTNAQPVEEVAPENIAIQQAAIVSCSGALLKDLEIAARILRGRKVHDGVRLLVSPATRRIWNEALHLGYIEALHDAGAVICAPTCGACGGHDMGILAPGETCISCSPRNMPGRMGAGGIVYLGSSASVAAAAVAGRIVDPREYLKGREDA